MTALRILALVEQRTPAHWIEGLRSALATVMTMPYELTVRVVIDPPSVAGADGSVLTRTLADALVGVDGWFRRKVHQSSRSGMPSSDELSRGNQRAARVLPDDGHRGAVVPTRFTDLRTDGHDLIVSSLQSTRTLLSAAPIGRMPVLWAECDGRVLGASGHGFLPPLADRAVTIDLRIHTAVAGGADQVVMRSRSTMRSVSPSLNEELLAARVTDLLAMCANAVLAAGSAHEPLAEVAPTDPEPGGTTAIGLRTLVRVAGRRVAATAGKTAGPLRWGLGYRRTAAESVEASWHRLPDSELLVPPTGTAWADPFPVRVEGCDLIFFEQEIAAEGRGHIAVAELLPDGRLGPVRRVLESTSHLSYPCIFQCGGEWFMVPESRASARVSLFRATEFPFRWVWERDLLTGVRLADPTVFERDGRWWLLACRIGAGESTHEDLVGYSAPSLNGPWKPIRQLPLTSDATAGRSAGHLLETAAGFLRPAQDGSRRYGYGLALRQVTCLTATDYAERDYLRVAPTWSPAVRGIHTFNRSDTLTLIDLLQVSP